MIRVDKAVYGKIAAATLIALGTLLFSSCHRGGKTSEHDEKEVILLSEEEMADLDVDPVVIDYEEPPVIIKSVRPKYPMAARVAGIECDVTVLVYIDESGDVRKASVESSSGIAGMDEAAKNAALEYKFKPAQWKGKPVGVWHPLVIQFRLNPGE